MEKLDLKRIEDIRRRFRQGEQRDSSSRDRSSEMWLEIEGVVMVSQDPWVAPRSCLVEGCGRPLERLYAGATESYSFYWLRCPSHPEIGYNDTRVR